MVRKTYSRNNHHSQDAFLHRSSVYLRRDHQVVHKKPVAQAKHIPVNIVTIPAVSKPTVVQEQFTLPPKRPTPQVLLRSDILPAQRTRVSL
jgi:hypothetical protein